MAYSRWDLTIRKSREKKDNSTDDFRLQINPPSSSL